MPTTTPRCQRKPPITGDKTSTINELALILQERYTVLGYQPGTALYIVTINDIFIAIALHLTEKSIQPAELTHDELEALIGQVAENLGGDDMPWLAMVSLGIREVQAKHLKAEQGEQTR